MTTQPGYSHRNGTFVPLSWCIKILHFACVSQKLKRRKNVSILYSPFSGSGGFCTTIKMKSSSGATRISCFRLLMRKYVNSLAGSKSRTIDLARSESCEINTEYYLYKKKKEHCIKRNTMKANDNNHSMSKKMLSGKIKES